MDQHMLWRKVAHDYEQLKERAPADYEPSVEVFLVGRQAPVEIGYVETSNAHDNPWIRLQGVERGASEQVDGTLGPKDYWVHVHERSVERVEIRFRRADAGPIGFAHRVADSLSDGSDGDSVPRAD
jgi:hypothetical protein